MTLKSVKIGQWYKVRHMACECVAECLQAEGRWPPAAKFRIKDGPVFFVKPKDILSLDVEPMPKESPQ